MREILFRGKRIDNGEWAYGYYAELPNEIGSDEPISPYILFTRQGAEFDSESYCAEVIPSTIGQYTGLKDKNGTKIFEGDILQHYDDLFNDNEYLGKVWYGYGVFCFGDDESGGTHNAYPWEECEVIGNIHEVKND